MIRIHKYMATAALVVLPLCATAQTNGSNSPYSRYGFGLLGDGGNAFNKGMSGTAYGMRNGKEINTKNPASYAALDSLSFIFDFGMSLQNGNFAQDGKKTNAHNTSIDYVSAGFRMAPRLGMSLGMMPFSTVGYKITSPTTTNVNNEGMTSTQSSTFKGDGGLHVAYVGVGYAPIKPLSLGVNVGYLWGDIEHNSTMQSAAMSSSDAVTTTRTYSTDIRTYKVDFGLQYEQRLNKKNSLTLGATYGLGHDVNRMAQVSTKRTVSTNTLLSDSTLNCKNAFQLPHTFGVGLTWTYNNALRVGVDYTLQKWSKVYYPMINDNATAYDKQNGLFNDVHKVSLGAEYIPNAEGIHWRDRVRYRAGVSYATGYTKINNVDGPKDIQASLGVALPIVNRYNNRTYLNLSAQYEHVKPKVAGMVTENYLRLCIGITFNERWFMKWKAE